MKNKNARPNCPPAEDLSAFLDGELETTERARVTAHLSRCKACAERLRRFGAADAAAEAAAGTELEPAFRLRLEAIPDAFRRIARRRTALGGLAAAALVALTASLALLRGSGPPVRLVAGDVENDGAVVRARTGATLSGPGGLEIALEPGARLRVDPDGLAPPLLKSGRARLGARKGAGTPVLLGTPAGDVVLSRGECEISVESGTTGVEPGRTSCRVLVVAGSGGAEWRSPDGGATPLDAGDAIFREIEIRTFGPAAGTTAAGDRRSFALYVYDDAGRPVDGAVVRLVKDDALRSEAGSGVSAISGRAEIDSVPVGDYRLRVEKSGFAPAERPIAVESAESTPRSIFLRPPG